MMRPEDWMRELAVLVSQAGFAIEASDFVLPEPEHGDLALPCFRLATTEKKPPHEIAQTIAGTLKGKVIAGSILGECQAAGPYVNFFLRRNIVSSAVIADIAARGEAYGGAKDKTEKILLEYVSPNTNKPLHVGHLRNAFIGHSVAKLLENQGAEVVRAEVINDRGVHIMKSLLAYMRWGNNETPQSAGMKGDHLVGKYYVRFSEEAKKNPLLEDETQQLLQRWEAGDKTLRTEWKKLNQWAEEGQHATCQRIGVSFDRVDRESEIYESGKALVMNALNRKLLKRRLDGAVTIVLENAVLGDRNNGEKVLLRADGTTVYITQDLALAEKRIKEVAPDRMLYVVGQEQDYHFKILFEILERLEIVDSSRLNHVSYHWVFLPDGRMKSREGTVVDADNLLDELRDLARAEVWDRAKELDPEEVHRRAEVITLAAAKYYLLRARPNSDIKFNPKESIAFTGDTGPYLLYTYARAQSILRKAESVPQPTEPKKVTDSEWRLVTLAANFPIIVKDAAAGLNPSLVSEFSYTLARAMNDFYEKDKILKASPQAREWRLYLLSNAVVVLKKSLDLLGIETLEEM